MNKIFFFLFSMCVLKNILLEQVNILLAGPEQDPARFLIYLQKFLHIVPFGHP